MRKLVYVITILLLAFNTWAQEKRITGKIINQETKQPVAGATVTVNGTQTATQTGTDGTFSVSVPNPDAVLSVTYVGMEPQQIRVGNQTDFSISMLSTTSNLNEIVVTGYQTQRKVDLVGAVAVADLKPIKNNSSGNPLQALQGRVAGLYIEKSGTPSGENSRVVIRGVNTLGNTDPLYVIDGVPTKSPQVFQSLNPGSIESVQILKDASAASIYGSRASNGVIIVTTKNGSTSGGKLNIQVNSGLTFQTLKPQKLDMMSAEERGRALWQGAVNDERLKTSNRVDPNTTFSNLYQFEWNGDYDKPVLNKVIVQPFLGGDQNVPAGNTDWQDALYDNALVTNNDLTISGGNKTSSFLMNLGYINNSGLMKFTGYERYSARLNASSQFFDGKLKFGMNSQFSTSNETLATTDLGGAPTPSLGVLLAPTIPVFTKDGKYAGPLGAGYSDRNNPVHIQWLNRWDNRNRTILYGNAFIDIEPIKNLFFRSNLGIEYNTILFKDIQLSFQEGFLGRNVNSLARNTDRLLGLTWSNTLNYQYELGSNRFNLLAGVEAVRQDVEAFGAFRENFVQQTEDYFYLNAGTGRSTNFGNSSRNRLLSQFGKINYAYGNKYLASVTLRRDGSSRFGENDRYGFFPAANIGWRINNEAFMQNIDAISNLKLRIGIGRVGNQDIGDFAHLPFFQTNYGTRIGDHWNTGTAYDLAGANTGNLPSGFVSVRAGNPNLKWETTEEVNVGVDFGFLNEKVYGSFDYFTRTTSDILILPPVASVQGEGRQRWVNGATKDNKGFEFVLGYRNQTKSGIAYTLQGNLSRFRDEITELPEEVRPAFPGNAERSILGQSQFAIFGFRTDGLFQSEAEVNAHAAQIGKGIGRIRYVDLNKDGQINGSDQDWLGTTLPAYEYGLRVDLSYKNFDFSAFGSGVAGRHGFEPYLFFNSFLRPRENGGPGLLNAWTPENTGSKTPMLTLVDANSEGKTSDYFIINTSYFKMRNVQLGYSLPQTAIRALRMSQLRFYLMGENLFWFKNKEYQGKDPEISNIDVIPIPTSVTFGLNVMF
jgi:TonB-dependent starch-binding outer membrane protein SusC